MLTFLHFHHKIKKAVFYYLPNFITLCFSIELKKAKNRRVLQGKYAHLLKKKHRKVSGIHAPSTSGSDTGGGGLDNLLISRSKNSSPTATTSYNNRSER